MLTKIINFPFLFLFCIFLIQGCNNEEYKEVTHGSPSISNTAGPRSTEIYSSFNNEGSQKFNVDSSILQPVLGQSELRDTVEELVLSFGNSESVEQKENSTEERYIVRAQAREPGPTAPTTESPDVAHVLEAPENETTDPTPTVRVTPEDIPSFSEWTQKQLAERKKTDPNVTEKVRSSKVRSKNYASPDCGAKIVAANPEAVSASSVLTSSRDEYMLNHCTARIWFIIELCEAVQAKQIDLANFELFSSSPKDITVSLGTRFPSRDWSPVGQFTAQDSRDIQTFDLNPQLFGKFLKVELQSHYGKEHYCPLSWVRVFGTSEYEVLATEDDRHGDDDDDLADEEAGDVPRNLFSSATDVVLSIVKKATAPFLKPEKMIETDNAPPSRCVSPRYLTVCNNCSQHTYDNVFYMLSCQQNALYQLIVAPYVRWILLQTETCKKYGLNFVNLREGAPFPLPLKPNTDHYLTALLKEAYIVALCNAVAVSENRVVVNMSLASPLRNTSVEPSAPAPGIPGPPGTSTCEVINVATSTTTTSPHRDELIQIQPTKTLREEQVKQLVEEDTSTSPDLILATSSQSQPSSVVPQNEFTSDNERSANKESPKVSFVDKLEEEEVRGNKEPDPSFDAILQDLSELENVVNEQPISTSSTPPPGSPKDSIFLRLANRIKALELNMSLSSSYLEELSRRYRLQTELLGQTVNTTATRLEQQIRLEESRNRRRDEEMSLLKEQLYESTCQLQKLMMERDSWLPRPSTLVWWTIQLLVVWYYLKRRGPPNPEEDANSREQRPQAGPVKSPRRRNSVECVTGHVLPMRPLERRPSDEALEITVSTSYSSVDRKRKKKRKDSSRKSSAVAVKRKRDDLPNGITWELDDLENNGCALVRQSSEPPPSVHVDGLAPSRDALATSNRFSAFSSPEPAPRPQLSRRFSSPAYMRTACASRADRTNKNPLLDETIKVKKESGFKKYMRKLF